MMKKNPKLYEINTIAWLYELSSKYGRRLTIGTVPAEEWDSLEKAGFDYIWLMGVWKRSKAGIRIFQNEPEYATFKSLFDSVLPGWDDEEDLVGSPYSIASYEPDPLIGSWEQIDIVRSELRILKMGLILDFVPNHTAPDHPWVFRHPEYYIQVRESDYKQNRAAYLPIHKEEKTLYMAHGKDPYFPPWTDTVQLNHFNPDMRFALIKELKKISEHCDGVRCDMAMLVLNDIFNNTWAWVKRYSGYELQESEFWKEVRRDVPEMLLIAEAYWDTEATLLSLGFDYVYDKRLYDLLEYASPSDLISYLTADKSWQKKLVRFIENHDEPRSAETFDRGKLFASSVLFSTLPGMKLYHQGQLEGKKIRLPVQLRRVKPEETDNELYEFYEKLLEITKPDLFANGDWELKNISPVFDESFHNLIAYIWTSEEDLALVVVNLSRGHSQGMISMEKETSAEADYILVDVLNNQEYSRSGKELMDPGLHVILEGSHSHIFCIKKK